MWTQTYGGTGDDTGSSLVITSDGGYALAGYTDSFGAGGRDFWLVKTDALGNVEWNQTYDETELEVATSLVETLDRGYALLGSTRPIDAGWTDIWLVKTDEYGVVPEAAWVILPLLLVATLSIFVSKKKLFQKQYRKRR